jgi:hypothetical protein
MEGFDAAVIGRTDTLARVIATLEKADIEFRAVSAIAMPWRHGSWHAVMTGKNKGRQLPGSPRARSMRGLTALSAAF